MENKQIFMLCNVAAKRSTLLLCVREFPGSNLGPECGYCDRFLVHPGIFQDSTLNYDTTVPNVFQFVIRPVIHYVII